MAEVDPVHEAYQAVGAMRSAGLTIVADVLKEGLDELRRRTAREVLDLMIRALRDEGEDNLANRLEKRVKGLWEQQSEGNSTS